MARKGGGGDFLRKIEERRKKREELKQGQEGGRDRGVWDAGKSAPQFNSAPFFCASAEEKCIWDELLLLLFLDLSVSLEVDAAGWKRKRGRGRMEKEEEEKGCSSPPPSLCPQNWVGVRSERGGGKMCSFLLLRSSLDALSSSSFLSLRRLSTWMLLFLSPPPLSDGLLPLLLLPSRSFVLGIALSTSRLSKVVCRGAIADRAAEEDAKIPPVRTHITLFVTPTCSCADRFLCPHVKDDCVVKEKDLYAFLWADKCLRCE